MKITYVGPQTEVVVPLADGKDVFAAKGETVEFPKAIAESLLRQSIWTEAKSTAREKVADGADSDQATPNS